MDRTYWALALGCNQAILDAVQREWLRQQPMAATFLTIVQCLNSFGMGYPDIKSVYHNYYEIDSDNYDEIFDALCQEMPWGELYWRLPGCTLIFEVHSEYQFRLCESPGPRYWPEELLCSDGKDWFYRLPGIVKKLQNQLPDIVEKLQNQLQ